MDKEPINNFRSPMVTAIGIILGFVLASMGKWATEPNPPKLSDWLVLIGYFVGITQLIVAMYRMLNHNYPQGKENEYYGKTLKIFISGICFSFLGVFTAIFQYWL